MELIGAISRFNCDFYFRGLFYKNEKQNKGDKAIISGNSSAPNKLSTPSWDLSGTFSFCKNQDEQHNGGNRHYQGYGIDLVQLVCRGVKAW